MSRRATMRAAVLGLLLTVSMPGGALATSVGVTVTTGTTIVPPPTIELSGPIGAILASGPVPLEWWSNDDEMAIVTVATDLTCGEPTCGAPGAPDTIGASALTLLQPSGQGLALDRSRMVAVLDSAPSEAASSTSLVVALAIPDVRPGRYLGTLTFTVIDPVGADRRVVAGPGGSLLIACSVVVIVS